MRVFTESGVVMDGGIGVVIFILGGVCAYTVALNTSAPAIAPEPRIMVDSVFNLRLRMRESLLNLCRFFEWRALPLAVQCVFLGPVEPHVHGERALRRWEPVGFQLFAR